MTATSEQTSARTRPYDRPQVGIWLAVVQPDNLIGFAQAAEAAGCDSLWVPEHLIWPQELTSSYPYRVDGGPPVPSDVLLYDPWVLLAATATATTRIKLGTCVYVLPLRDPLVTARAVATLDVVSGGRAILGAGLGWMREEFDAVGIDFKSRGERCDEIVPALRSLWSDELTSAEGKHINFPPLYFNPKPPQGASLPIVFGGESNAALRRAARLGDGWLGTWHDVRVHPRGHPAAGGAARRARASRRTVRDHRHDQPPDHVRRAHRTTMGGRRGPHLHRLTPRAPAPVARHPRPPRTHHHPARL